MDDFLNELPQQPEQQPEAPRPGRGLFEWLQMALGCILTAVLIFNFVARLSRVSGSSMDPTLQNGELMLVWSLGYHPRPGDVVVLNKSTAEFLGGVGGEAIVKRVIAVGGQSVDIDYNTNTVYVDGVALDEDYTNGPMIQPLPNSLMDQTHWQVPEGEIFVMGDNRNASTDSRHQWLGPIDEGYVLGRASMALLPMDRFGPI